MTVTIELKSGNLYCDYKLAEGEKFDQDIFSFAITDLIEEMKKGNLKCLSEMKDYFKIVTEITKVE